MTQECLNCGDPARMRYELALEGSGHFPDVVLCNDCAVSLSEEPFVSLSPHVDGQATIPDRPEPSAR